MTTVSVSAQEALAMALAAHAGEEGPLLPVLQDLQAALGYIPAELFAPLAAAFDVTVAEVWGVVSFYHDFRTSPAGAQVLRLCRAEACQAQGSAALAEAIIARAGIGFGETTPDGRLTLEAVYCLGLCACGPAALVNGRLVGRLDAAKARGLLDAAGVP